jgi:hypothetical protein
MGSKRRSDFFQLIEDEADGDQQVQKKKKRLNLV